jgi:hypothetical protein
MVMFRISVFNPLISCIKKNKIHHKVQHEKLYKLYKTDFFIVAYFAFKMDNILSDQISTLLKDNANEKFLFIFLSPVQIVELFTLHLSSYSIFS